MSARQGRQSGQFMCYKTGQVYSLPTPEIGFLKLDSVNLDFIGFSEALRSTLVMLVALAFFMQCDTDVKHRTIS